MLSFFTTSKYKYSSSIITYGIQIIIFFFTFYANQQTSRKSTSLQIMQIGPILFCIFKVWYCAVAAEAAATKAAAASMKS